MDEQKFRIGDRKRPLKGLKDGGMVTLRCTTCMRKLLCLQLTSIEGEPTCSVLTRIAVLCGFCGGHSCVEQVIGQFYPGAPSDDVMIDLDNRDTTVVETDILFRASAK